MIIISLQVDTLALTPDGTLLATAGRDKDVVLSSIYLSLDEIDALPVNDLVDNHGAMLWRKYTRKVMQRSKSKASFEIAVRCKLLIPFWLQIKCECITHLIKKLLLIITV